MLMDPAVQAAPADGWDVALCAALIDELQALRSAMLAHERHARPVDRRGRARAAPPARATWRTTWRCAASMPRGLQERLARLGLSSLGRAETHVLANLDKVLGLLHRADRPALGQARRATSRPASAAAASAARQPQRRAVRAAPRASAACASWSRCPARPRSDAALVGALVHAGMDVARINCAHDDAPAWAAMAAHVRRAAAHGRAAGARADGPGRPEDAHRADRRRPERAQGQAGARRRSAASPRRRCSGCAPSVRTRRSTAPPTLIGVDPDWLAQLQPGRPHRLHRRARAPRGG